MPMVFLFVFKFIALSPHDFDVARLVRRYLYFFAKVPNVYRNG